ncbi:MAG TPA: DUF721 domain-containing protein [Firmicutes bacterium]|nr:DUF721 domain-containing protein [Bacillota bacterium]
MRKVTPLAQIITGFLTNWSQNSPMQTGLAAYYWPQVIGEALKDKTEVSQVKNGILWIKTPDPALAYNLTFFKKEIINKYRRYLGKKNIRGVRVTVGALSAVDVDDQKGKTKGKLLPASDLTLPAALTEIKDSDLKKAFTNFYYAHERRKTFG